MPRISCSYFHQLQREIICSYSRICDFEFCTALPVTIQVKQLSAIQNEMFWLRFSFDNQILLWPSGLNDSEIKHGL